jgi:demethylmenaquinone methyltransferase/2-methoxy-6-polyprenyl-1,4-benzoquinol methylase
VRNFENLEKGIADIYRVLNKDGILVILEFSKPKHFPVKQIYHFYFKYITPMVGKMFSKDKSAYTYLPESVNAFPAGEEFLSVLKKTGFKDTKDVILSFGIASIYIAKK